MTNMTAHYLAPKKDETSFHCPLCQVVAHQTWRRLDRLDGNRYTDTAFSSSRCAHCGGFVYWHEDRMIVPALATAPPAHIDLPDGCKDDYDEARDIANRSPRAAAALLRLAVQKLMPVLGQPGKNINDDIKRLVQSGLPAQVQMALDYCRVVGNNAVHPGEINLDDTPDIVHNLFGMINFIVQDRITRPKEIETLFMELPPGAREAIDKRDKK